MIVPAVLCILLALPVIIHIPTLLGWKLTLVVTELGGGGGDRSPDRPASWPNRGQVVRGSSVALPTVADQNPRGGGCREAAGQGGAHAGLMG